jgi:hypothetical protein
MRNQGEEKNSVHKQTQNLALMRIDCTIEPHLPNVLALLPLKSAKAWTFLQDNIISLLGRSLSMVVFNDMEPIFVSGKTD